MTRPTIECDILFASAVIEPGNLSRVLLSGVNVPQSYEGKHISIANVGASGATVRRTIANVVNLSTIDLDAPAVQAFQGTKCMLGTDNAPAIQAAIDAGGVVDISGYDRFGTSSLNFTGNRARGLVGDGVPYVGPWLYPFSNSGTLLDFGGRRSIMLEGFTFGADPNGPGNPNVPDCGLLIGGTNDGGVDHLNLTRVCGTGYFRKATFDAHNGAGNINACAFWNYQTGGYGWAWDPENVLGLSSAGGSFSVVYENSPWTVNGSEAHAGTLDSFSMLFRGVRNLAWSGGIISGYVGHAGHAVVAQLSNGENGMQQCDFRGTRFEGEGGSAVHIFRADSCNGWVAGRENIFGTVLPDGSKRTSNLFGCSGDIVTGSAAANFRANAVGLPRA